MGGWVDYLNGEESAYLDEPIKRVINQEAFIIEAGGNVRCNLDEPIKRVIEAGGNVRCNLEQSLSSHE